MESPVIELFLSCLISQGQAWDAAVGRKLHETKKPPSDFHRWRQSKEYEENLNYENGNNQTRTQYRFAMRMPMSTQACARCCKHLQIAKKGMVKRIADV
jgi:hypothetical protein